MKRSSRVRIFKLLSNETFHEFGNFKVTVEGSGSVGRALDWGSKGC